MGSKIAPSYANLFEFFLFVRKYLLLGATGMLWTVNGSVGQ